MPVCYLKRASIKAGEYPIFYRVAFRHQPKSPLRTGGSGAAKMSSPGSAVSSKVNAMDDGDGLERGSDFFHEQRKIVLSLNFPAHSKLQM